MTITNLLGSILGLMLLIAPTASAQTGEIKALIIGNDAYQQAGMFPSLRGTPRRDAEAVEDALRSAGVAKKNIVTLHDLDYKSFVDAIYNFRQMLNPEDSAIFYYSGHGFSIDDHAYLVPVDFRLGPTRRNAQLRSVSLDQVKKELSKARMRALIIDACRTNIPLLKQASGAKSDTFLKNLYDAKHAGTGELIVFATQGGRPAIADSPSGGLSFFTYYLVERLKIAPSDLGTVVKQAQIATSIQSNHGQQPDVRDSLQGLLQFPNDLSSPSPPISSVAQTPSLPPATTDYDTMLPLICPKNNELVIGWKTDGVSYLLPDKGEHMAPVSVDLQVIPSSVERLPIRVNPIIRRGLGIPPISLDLKARTEIGNLYSEIDSALNLPEPPRSANGAIVYRRRYISIMHIFEQRSSLVVQYDLFAGSVQVSMRTPEQVALTDLSGPMRVFVSHLDQLAEESGNQACESLLKRLNESPK